MSELNLQLGEWYRQRNGKIAGPLSHSGGNDYPFEDEFESWTLSGVYSIGEQSESDLIAHIPRTDPRHPEYKPEQSAQPEMIAIMMSVPRPPEGWEVAGYRVPVVGEMRFMHGEWRHVKNQCNFRWPVAERCTPPWTPPSWLAPGWIEVDNNCSVYLFKRRPSWS